MQRCPLPTLMNASVTWLRPCRPEERAMAADFARCLGRAGQRARGAECAVRGGSLQHLLVGLVGWGRWAGPWQSCPLVPYWFALGAGAGGSGQTSSKPAVAQAPRCFASAYQPATCLLPYISTKTSCRLSAHARQERFLAILRSCRACMRLLQVSAIQGWWCKGTDEGQWVQYGSTSRHAPFSALRALLIWSRPMVSHT